MIRVCYSMFLVRLICAFVSAVRPTKKNNILSSIHPSSLAETKHNLS